MPLFFILAGMSVRLSAVKSWRYFLRRNILALLVPYFVWGMIYAPFTFKNILPMAYGSWENLAKIGTLTSLWYLPCFFAARIITQFVVSFLMAHNIKNIPLWCGIAAVPALVIGFMIPHPTGGLPFGIDIAFVASGVILLGMASQKTCLSLHSRRA